MLKRHKVYTGLGQTRKNTNLLIGVYSKHRQLACQVGAFTRSDVNIRPWMACHGISWVPGAHMHFGDLDFTGHDVITEMLEELRLHAPEAHAPGSSQLLNFDYGRLER